MEINEMIKYIKPELLILIPVIYFIGVALKNSEAVKNNLIPLILGVVGVVLSILYILGTSDLKSIQDIMKGLFSGVTQGIMCAGSSVYMNQIIKQNINKVGEASNEINKENL